MLKHALESDLIYGGTPATYCFFMMISSESCDRKPYAGLKESNMRCLVTIIIEEMIGQGMKVWV